MMKEHKKKDKKNVEKGRNGKTYTCVVISIVLIRSYLTVAYGTVKVDFDRSVTNS